MSPHSFDVKSHVNKLKPIEPRHGSERTDNTLRTCHTYHPPKPPSCLRSCNQLTKKVDVVSRKLGPDKRMTETWGYQILPTLYSVYQKVAINYLFPSLSFILFLSPFNAFCFCSHSYRIAAVSLRFGVSAGFVSIHWSRATLDWDNVFVSFPFSHICSVLPANSVDKICESLACVRAAASVPCRQN